MQEHRLLNEITMTALRRLPITILLYKSPSTIKFTPNLLIDINDEYETKVKAIQCHATQSYKEYMQLDAIKIFNQGWNGKNIGIDFYEQFNILRMVK
jgi:LmbE family N-acetylglucosaminyl deacetylase